MLAAEAAANSAIINAVKQYLLSINIMVKTAKLHF